MEAVAALKFQQFYLLVSVSLACHCAQNDKEAFRHFRENTFFFVLVSKSCCFVRSVILPLILCSSSYVHGILNILSPLHEVARGRRTVDDLESSTIDRCNILQQKQDAQKLRIPIQLSNCNGLIIGPGEYLLFS